MDRCFTFLKRSSRHADLKISIRESGCSETTPARTHIMDADGEAYYAEGCPRFERDHHFTSDGRFEVTVPAGRLSLLVEKGKQYRSVTREVAIQAGEDLELDIKIDRWINMAERGWYSGDLHIHRPLEDMPQLLLAEDLNVAPVITAWNQRNEWTGKEIPADKVVNVDETHACGILAQEDERGGGAVMVMNLDAPIDLGEASRWYPPGMAYCRVAHEQGRHVDQEKPFWWEAPVNVALGGVDSIGIINNHMQRVTVMDSEAWGRPRDRDRYPGFEGFVENVLDLYYRYLDLGFKLPISAGSASGVLRCPVGYNRLYVRMEDGFDYEEWFEGMKSGRAFATNGPMLFFAFEGHDPGTTLTCPAGEKLNGTASIECLSQTQLGRVELIFNGEIIHRSDANGESECCEEVELSFDTSGWLIARAFEKNNETVRFAHTNPVYIEVGGTMKPRREAADYYRNWCQELLANSAGDEERYASVAEREAVESLYREAVEFYEELGNQS